MYIFSSSPRNQLPNHGLQDGDHHRRRKIPATATSNSENQLLPRNQLPNQGLRAEDKYYWQEVPATTSSNSEPQQLTGLGLASGVKYVENDNQHLKLQPGALVFCRRVSCSNCDD